MRTNAIGYKDVSTVYPGDAVWTAWADFQALLSAKDREIGDEVDGELFLSAYLADGYINPDDRYEDFTLRISGWWIFKYDDSRLEHHYAKAQGSASQAPYGWAKSSGSCGGVTPKVEKWPDNDE